MSNSPLSGVSAAQAAQDLPRLIERMHRRFLDIVRIVDEAPLAVGLSYLNNIAHAHGMVPLFQFGIYAGTFGPYDMNAVRGSS